MHENASIIIFLFFKNPWSFFLQRATESVFTCILDSISSEHGVTCTASYKDTVIETYSPNLRSISTASLDPRQCKMLTCVLFLIHN